ncbi:MAG: 4Fe-4S dicluster domain-containing protein [Planctomycetota bacterium]|nr:4Fe-4S dicluster domain-containing protein [Planctomycetota bacterium]
MERVVTAKDLAALADDMLRAGRTVAGPVRRKERYFYEAVSRGADLAFDFNYCVYSPRSFFFPPGETLLTYSIGTNELNVAPEAPRTSPVIMGVHPCDCNAIGLLDAVFGSGVPDDHYLARRKDSVVVAVDCHGPCDPTAFCRDMGGNEAQEGFDVMLTPLNGGKGQAAERYLAAAATERGRELLAYNKVGKEPARADRDAAEKFREAKAANFSRRLPYAVEKLPAILDRSYNSLLWQVTAKRCYSCGSCNLVCPTCYCFTVKDVPDLSCASGKRVREWDGCQLQDFATVAGGHNFRPESSSRLRHRIFRKGKWIKEQQGRMGCVGCGRCDRACTAKISVVEIYTQLAEEA